MIKKAIIEVNNLNKAIGNKQILSNISFTLEPEEHLVIIGSSGAGKSMLIKCLLGLEDLSSGSIFFENNLVSGNEDKQRLLNKLGVCFQSNALFDSYKTWENIAFKTLYNERSPNISKLKKLAIERLEEVGLPSNIAEHYPSELSGGMQKRVGIARSIFSEPDILIFDEATSALDNVTEQAVMEAVSNLGNQITIIIIAHRLSTVRNCDQIFLLSKGQLEASGTYSELIISNRQFAEMVRQV